MDRSSIQRAFQDLSEMKLIKRNSISMKDYSNVKGIEEAKKKANEITLYIFITNDK